MKKAGRPKGITTPLTSNDRQKAFVAARKAEGKVKLNLWVHPRDKEALLIFKEEREAKFARLAKQQAELADMQKEWNRQFKYMGIIVD